MNIKFYVDRYVSKHGWVRVTSGLDRMEIAENMKKTLADRYQEDMENFSICVVGM